MAVISELIDAGLKLKTQGKHEAAIEHFRQLHETYPDNARVKFELAAAWATFGVPEQALPLYRELLALPKRKGLPAKDLPRLYARLTSTLYDLREFEEALAVVEEGLRLHPSYRPLRAFRIFSHFGAGQSKIALLDALDLMLDSLAPSRWDIFEDDVKALVSGLRQSLIETDQRHDEEELVAADAVAARDRPAVPEVDPVESPSNDEEVSAVDQAAPDRIDVASADAEADDHFELEVKVMSSARKPKKKKSRSRKGRQLSESKVRINISAADEESRVLKADSDDEPDGDGAKVNIPIDFD